MFSQFMMTAKQHMDKNKQYMVRTNTLNSQVKTIHNLVVQIGQIANANGKTARFIS